MGPGFLIFFPEGESPFGPKPPMQIALSLVNYKSKALQIRKTASFGLGITQKLQCSVKIVK
jgi:hypothetical protein